MIRFVSLFNLNEQFAEWGVLSGDRVDREGWLGMAETTSWMTGLAGLNEMIADGQRLEPVRKLIVVDGCEIVVAREAAFEADTEASCFSNCRTAYECSLSCDSD